MGFAARGSNVTDEAAAAAKAIKLGGNTAEATDSSVYVGDGGASWR